MRLYLSSYRLGNHIDRLMQLVGSGRKLALIENAIDHISSDTRKAHRRDHYDIADNFEDLGFDVTELDLREYFDNPDSLKTDLKPFDVVWCTGGNVFLLRRAMKQSGFDEILKDSLAQDRFVYGGWSAGICVLSTSLKGLELCDPPNALSKSYDPQIPWEGLGILNTAIIPHYKSDHQEAELVERIVQQYETDGTPFRAIRDGDVLLYEGGKMSLLELEKGQPSRFNLDKKQ